MRGAVRVRHSPAVVSGAHHHHDHYDGKHDHGVPLGPKGRRALLVALVLTASFMVVELVVGFWASSLALMADAGHMLNDAAALGLSLFVTVVAARPRTARHTYGYRRAEVMGALANAAMLVGAAAVIVTEAIGRLSAPPDVRGSGMLIAAGLGLVVNIVVAWVLSREAQGSINVKAALFHVLGDLLGSIGAIAAGILVVTLGWNLADPIVSMFIAALIALGALRLARDAVRVLMEAAPPEVDVDALEATIRETPDVLDMHDLHVWCLVPGTTLLSAHVVVADGTAGIDISRHIRDRIAEAHGIEHCTIQPEHREADPRCKNPPCAAGSG